MTDLASAIGQRAHPLLLVGSICCACGPSRAPADAEASPILMRETFESASDFAATWTHETTSKEAALVRISDGLHGRGLDISIPKTSSGAEVAFVRSIPVGAASGTRVRLEAHVRGAAGAVAHVGLRATAPGRLPSYAEIAQSPDSRGTEWDSIYAVVDVPADAAAVEVTLSAIGPGEVWIDDVSLERVAVDRTANARSLTDSEVAHLKSLALVSGLVRFFHPSDQAATLDWDTFTVTAVDKVLAIQSDAEFALAMRTLFAEVAPTAQFYSQGATPPPMTLPQGGNALARWRRLGFGTIDVYRAFRENVDDEPSTGLTLFSTIPRSRWQHCHRLEASMTAAGVSGSPTGKLELRLRRGGRSVDEPTQPIDSATGARTILVSDLSEEVRTVELGISVSGHGSLDLELLRLACDGSSIDLTSNGIAWTEEGDARFLYEHEAQGCGRPPCVRLRRREPRTTFDPKLDVVDLAIGSGLRARIPSAVWTTGGVTLPAVTQQPALPSATILDADMRLAAVITTWVTLRHFYPNFADGGAEWDLALSEALRVAATETSAAAFHEFLRSMVVKLHDRHALVKHPASPIDGFLPLSLRWVDESLVVSGGIEPYLSSVKVGAEVLSIDGAPAASAFHDRRSRVSASTEASVTYFAEYALAMGPKGSIASLDIKEGATTRAIVLPRIDRGEFGQRVRESRPASGTELLPGVIYADAADLDAQQWASLRASVQGAKVLILDLRSFPTSDIFDVLANFLSEEARSPRFMRPIVGPSAVDEGGYEEHQWVVEPAPTRLRQRLIVLEDVRPQSFAETVLQLIKENSIGTLVGEPSGGTNGNVARIAVPGGFTVQFTGMKTLFKDGTELQGHGVEPDVVVHPSSEAIREGRDDILAAAIELAKNWIARSK